MLTIAGLAAALFGGAQAGVLDASIALDAVYIPALSLTNAKPGDTAAADKARETLHGLLILRIKLEAEMIELGFSPPALVAPPESAEQAPATDMS